MKQSYGAGETTPGESKDFEDNDNTIGGRVNNFHRILSEELQFTIITVPHRACKRSKDNESADKQKFVQILR